MNKGFTLIEVMVSMSIMMLIYSLSFYSFSNYKNYVNKKELDFCNSSIIEFICNSKQYCREKFKRGRILFYPDQKTIEFFCDERYIDKFVLPKDFRLKVVNTPCGINCIEINKYGMTGDGCTIEFADKNQKSHFIEVDVGTAYVEFKN